MELRRWTNPHQPQTLQVAVFLLYIRAVLAFIPGLATTFSYYGTLASTLAAVALAFGGLGIANDKRWGYRLAVVISFIGVLPLLILLIDIGPQVLLQVGFILLALFPVAQLALLLHPMSREHQRIWFT